MDAGPAQAANSSTVAEQIAGRPRFTDFPIATPGTVGRLYATSDPSRGPDLQASPRHAAGCAPEASLPGSERRRCPLEQGAPVLRSPATREPGEEPPPPEGGGGHEGTAGWGGSSAGLVKRDLIGTAPAARYGKATIARSSSCFVMNAPPMFRRSDELFLLSQTSADWSPIRSCTSRRPFES